MGPTTPALTYQWLRNGVKISGATKPSLTFAKASLANVGAYSCLVKSGTLLPPVASASAEIGVVDTTARILNLKAGVPFTPSVVAAGNGLSFVWAKNGGNTIGQTASKFTITAVAAGDSGQYTCAVSAYGNTITNGYNTYLTVTDAIAELDEFIPPPATIGQSYFYQVLAEGPAGSRATSFALTGTLPKGITFNPKTGVFSGRPTTSKPTGYPLTLKGVNSKGSSLGVTATLIVNVVPPTVVGNFAGPMLRASLNDNLGGRFDLTTTSTGTFTGSVQLGARKLAFKNQLLLSSGEGDIILRGNIPGFTMQYKTPLTAYVEVFAADQTAVLTLVHPDGRTLQGTAWRKPWLLSKTVALNKPATDYAAYYTARLDAGQGGTVSPDGYGYTSFTISTAGTLTLAGKLPDGSAVTGGTHVGPDGQVMLFNLLHGNRGSHVGRFDIAKATPVTNNTLTGTSSWLKPAPLPKSTDTVYKAGFGPLNVTAQGSVYVAPTAGNLVMGLPVVPSNQSNAKMSFSEGGIATLNSFHQPLRFFTKTPQDSVSLFGLLPPLNNSTKLTALDSKKGTFSGSFTINGATAELNLPAPFVGQIVKIGATTEGYGYFLLPKVPVPPETVATSPKLSGRAVLGVP